MPIYELLCLECRHPFTVLQTMSDPIPLCPECNSNNVKRQISLASFHLKGGGVGWEKEGYSGKE